MTKEKWLDVATELGKIRDQLSVLIDTWDDPDLRHMIAGLCNATNGVAVHAFKEGLRT